MGIASTRPVTKDRPAAGPEESRGRVHAVRTRASRGGLGRSFLLSALLHGVALGALVFLGVRGGGLPPRPVTLEASVAAEVTLEEIPPLDPRPPEVAEPPADGETLLEEVQADPDPRLLDSRSPRATGLPDMGIPGPGPGTTPRAVRRPRSGGSGRGALQEPPSPAAVAAPAPQAAAQGLLPARRDAERCPSPVYPSRERDRGIEGTVRLRVAVAADGTVESVEVASSSGSAALDASAAEAVRSWRFLPATLDGAAVHSVVLQPVSFGLVDRR